MARPDAATETPRKGNLAALAILLPHLARCRGLIAAACVALMVAAGATLTLPLAVRRVIDLGFSPENAGFIDRYFLMLIAVAGLLAVASAARYYLVTMIGERVATDLRSAVFAHLTRLDAAFFDRSRSGEIISRLTSDATQIKSAVGASVSIALRNALMFTGAIIMMVYTSPHLAGYVLGAIPLIVLPLVLFGRRVRRYTRAAQDALADASAIGTEAAQAVPTLQAFGAEAAVRARFDAALAAYYAATQGATRMRSGLTGVAIMLVFSGVVGVLWIGAGEVLRGALSAGSLGQFVLYAVLGASALGELSQVWGEIAQAAGSAERIGELLDTRPAIRTPAVPRAMPVPARAEIAFQGVGFAYPARPDIAILKGIDFAVTPGERVALVGPSGAGKSTVFALILRAYDPSSGVVRLDGEDLTQVDPAEARARTAIVPQDPTILSGTIADNIRLGRPEADDSAVAEAGRLARVDEFVARLPDGYATIVGERGITLSGGQRQRVAIARAILKNAPILLLDEATSALDAESEALVAEGLAGLMAGRTTLVIAHRLATVLSADRILVLDQGRIAEQGTHRQLIAQGGLYARLARLQFTTGGAEDALAAE